MRNAIILIIFVFVSFIHPQVKYITSTDSLYLVSISDKINEGFTRDIKDYNAGRYADIIKHPTLKLYAIPIDTLDTRKPLKYLSPIEKSALKDIGAEWFPQSL